MLKEFTALCSMVLRVITTKFYLRRHLCDCLAEKTSNTSDDLGLLKFRQGLDKCWLRAILMLLLCFIACKCWS